MREHKKMLSHYVIINYIYCYVLLLHPASTVLFFFFVCCLDYVRFSNEIFVMQNQKHNKQTKNTAAMLHMYVKGMQNMFQCCCV